MFALGVSEVMTDFNTSNNYLSALVVSIYVLGFAFGPLFWAPLSEIYGRWICYSVSNILYIIFTIACAVSTNMSMLIVFRFLAGCFGSSALAIGGGTVTDMFPVQHRGVALSLYTLGPICGPAIGPVIGGFVSAAKGWRWIFWVLSILGGAVTFLQVFYMRETSATIILRRKAKRLRKTSGNSAIISKIDADKRASGSQILLQGLVRPLKLMLLSPISFLLSIATAFIYGLLYLLLTTLPMVFEEGYGFGVGITGVTYVGLGIGNLIGLFVFSLTSDRYIRARIAEGKMTPEDRLPYILVSCPLMAAGLFLYGWTAEARTLWIGPVIGLTLFGVGNTLFMNAVIGYLIDSFTQYAASALAANTVLRSVGGALLPLAGDSMYQSLRFGWGNSVLGFLALGFTPALIALYKYGESIRLKYPLKL
ncbi:major facilitator superfamily domain-containing protein [Talaromyces proteolyticus]|uniref:Major facilitator superfamily domain-containing protein n=1 Tax=Talaromyces proteolyticus TaxID=1131652 RepID=A0AAD4PUB0_9EURO|nr:major facilitator superfamily domain-containing protein [Talaromyces proteolyticus]KAH8692035.1 major facilitator superfamily domain-containing protein [Talaromyces proteolyticus]